MPNGRAGAGSVALPVLGLVAGFMTGASNQLREPALRVALRTEQVVTSGSTLLAGDTFAFVRVDMREPVMQAIR